jgi:hypothetical protein
MVISIAACITGIAIIYACVSESRWERLVGLGMRSNYKLTETRIGRRAGTYKSYSRGVRIFFLVAGIVFVGVGVPCLFIG